MQRTRRASGPIEAGGGGSGGSHRRGLGSVGRRRDVVEAAAPGVTIFGHRGSRRRRLGSVEAPRRGGVGGKGKGK